MNSIMTNYYQPVFHLYQRMRHQIMEILTDADLASSPGGTNLSLGALCREVGEVEYAYIQSFKTFTLDFSYRNPEPGLESSVAKLVAWFETLDAELQTVIKGLSEEDIQGRVVDRGGDHRLSLQVQLYVYQEALLIFYGKASVYLKALNKNLPEQFRNWIA
jgi:hypothetical protein